MSAGRYGPEHASCAGAGYCVANYNDDAVDPCDAGETGILVEAEPLREFLERVGADRLPDGRFRYEGEITSFMGAGDEFAIKAGARYFKDGRARPLVPHLRREGIGVPVTVI